MGKKKNRKFLRVELGHGDSQEREDTSCKSAVGLTCRAHLIGSEAPRELVDGEYPIDAGSRYYQSNWKSCCS